MDKLKLGSLVRIRTGKLDANKACNNGLYPFFTCAIEPLKINAYAYDTECVLVAGNGDLNVKYYNGKFNAYQRTYIIESLDKNVLSVRYLFWFLSLYVSFLRYKSIGGVIKYIKLENLTEAEIAVPSLEVQREIVAKFDLINWLIKQKRIQIGKLEALTHSRFLEMFGMSEGIDKHLEDVADICSGITKGRKVLGLELREVPYMAVSNVKMGYIDLSTVKTIMATENEIEQYRLFPNDILMTEGGDPDKVGRGAIIRNPPKDCIHQNHIFRVRLHKDVLLPEFFEEYLQGDSARRYFLKAAKQTTGIASINMKQLRALPVKIPPIKVQIQYSDFVHQVDKSKMAVQKSLDELETLKKSLMQTYFG